MTPRIKRLPKDCDSTACELFQLTEPLYINPDGPSMAILRPYGSNENMRLVSAEPNGFVRVVRGFNFTETEPLFVGQKVAVYGNATAWPSGVEGGKP